MIQKILFLLQAIIICLGGLVEIKAQAPQKLSYQAVIRNAGNLLITNHSIGMRITILQGSPTGSSVYAETQNTTSNSNGLVSIQIGNGTVISGSLATINWGNGPYFIKTETDPLGGASYSITSTKELQSVPYALYANRVNSIPPGDNTGDMQFWNGTTWVMIPIGAPGQVLQITQANIPKWSGGKFATLTTNAITNTTLYTSATCGGNITNDGITSEGGSTVTVRGVCYDTLPNPTVLNLKTTNGSGSGAFTSSLTQLLASTTYFVRAYATTSVGTAYGNQQTFTTLPNPPPTVTTTIASSITGGSASAGGNVTNTGGTTVTARGVCWSTSPNPTTANSKTTDGSGLGTFTSFMNHLDRNTTYFIRAYATNTGSTGYGNEITMTTSAAFTIGGAYLGGIIAYVLQSGDPGYSASITHGLIAAPSDIGTMMWSNSIPAVAINNTSNLIGTGNANTISIVSQQVGGFGYAASACSNLVIGSFSDWYLPSRDELAKLFLNRALIGNFFTAQTSCGTFCLEDPYYWSSSSNLIPLASAVSFYNSGSGSQVNKDKTEFLHVRAIKSW